MKKILFSLIIMMLTIPLSKTMAQNVIEEGYIKMEIVDATSDNEQMAMGLEMMKGSQTEIFFKGSQSLSKMSMMGGMVESTTLFNTDTEKMDMLFNAMGQKMHIESTAEERNLLQNEQTAIMREMEVTYDESDTKVILGYSCIKANISHPSIADGMSFSMYISKDIKASPKMLHGLSEFALEGFPLEYVLSMPQMTMTISAIEFNNEVSDDVFNLDTGGYQKMTMKEFQEKMAAFGGGMGF